MFQFLDQTLSLRRLTGAICLGTGLLVWQGAALAVTYELRPHRLIDAQQSRCPEKVLAYQTARPYQEGSFAWDGTVSLGAIATKIAVAKVDPFSVTWVGTLKAPYQSCRATAGILKVDGAAFTETSYLRMQFVGGKAYFILDMTGLQDANQLTPKILSHQILNGNPRWRWGGTD